MTRDKDLAEQMAWGRVVAAQKAQLATMRAFQPPPNADKAWYERATKHLRIANLRVQEAREAYFAEFGADVERESE